MLYAIITTIFIDVVARYGIFNSTNKKLPTNPYEYVYQFQYIVQKKGTLKKKIKKH